MLSNSVYSNRTRILEFVAVLLTGFGKFVLVDWLNLKFWYILIASTCWIGYITWRIRHHPALPAYWGFTKKGFSESLRWILPFAVVSIIAFYIYGSITNALLFNWHILPVLVSYPCWGIIQQFLIIGLIIRNLADYDGKKIPKVLIILIATTLFAIVHYPVILLVAGTFVLALLYSLVYWKHGNLWVLGLFHGWLGGFFYFFVLGRDPWLEFLAAIQK